MAESDLVVSDLVECQEVVRQGVSTVPFVDIVPSESIVYHQILVNAGDELQVTFDDNKDDNCWSYHRGGNYPNVSELFHMNWVSKDNNEVEIFGYLPPPSRGRQTIWYLTVLEDGRGVPERHPKFRPEQEPMQELMMNNQSLHKVFKVDPEDESGRFSLSFKTNDDSTTVYLVPGSRKKMVSMITRATTSPGYPFTKGTSDKLRSMNIGWEKIVER